MTSEPEGGGDGGNVNGGGENEKNFFIDRAKQGRANCKKCKQKCPIGELRIAKLAPNPLGTGKIKMWHHPDCLFQQFLKQRVTTKRIKSPDDIDGWEILSAEDQQQIVTRIEVASEIISDKCKNLPSTSIKKPKRVSFESISLSASDTETKTVTKKMPKEGSSKENKDSNFKEFRRLITDINESKPVDKTKLIKTFLTKGTDGSGFKGNLYLWARFLLPTVDKRLYNITPKQLVGIFSKILKIDHNVINDHLKGAEFGETIQYFFQINDQFVPKKRSTLTMQDVDKFLSKLPTLKDEDVIDHFKKIIAVCTSNDLKVLVRLIKHDLNMKAGVKHVMEGIHPKLYVNYQKRKNLKLALESALSSKDTKTTSLPKVKTVTSQSPVTPTHTIVSSEQETDAKRSIEIVRIHKYIQNVKFFSKENKPILPQKLSHLKDSLLKAFVHTKDSIFECQYVSDKPLSASGTSSPDKREKCCFYVIDCLQLNGESLTDKTLDERKAVLLEHLVEIPDRVLLTKLKISSPKSSSPQPTTSVSSKQSVDLIILGKFFSSKKFKDKVSFLMGYYEPKRDVYVALTRVVVSSSLVLVKQIQDQLKYVEVRDNTPEWLDCSESLRPDFTVKNLKNLLVVKVVADEFTGAKGVAGAQIRNIKKDKNPQTVTRDALKDCFGEIVVAKNEIKKEKSKTVKRKAASDTNKVVKKARKDVTVTEPIVEVVEESNEVFKIFEGVKLLLEPGADKQFENTLDDFVILGGVLVPQEHPKDATHVLHLEDTVSEQNIVCSKNVRHVIEEWIFDSASKGTLQDFRPYTVRWKPDHV